MKVLLIRPNSSIHATPPPLGLLYLASYLRSAAPHYETTILDARRDSLHERDVEAFIASVRPDFIGITGLHADAAEVHRVAALAGQAVPRAVVIAGGPYVTGDYAKALRDSNIDYCVIGEGEHSFFELLEALRQGLPTVITGVAGRAGGEIVFHGRREPIADLDSIPFPAWDLIDLRKYFYGRKRSVENPVQVRREAVPLLTSRGCPFGCVYCHDVFGKKFRARSAENIVAEIALLKQRYGVGEIEIIDDTFNLNRKRLVEFCDLLVDRTGPIPICFSNGIRADLVDREVLAKLKAAGVYRINYGIETASPRLQTFIDKRLDLGYARAMIDETVDQGIMCGAFFMLGFPGETEEEMLATIRYAVSSRLHTAVFSIVTPYPGSRLYGHAVQGGGQVSFSTVGKVVCNLSAVSDARLAGLRIMAYRTFYFSPRRWRALFMRVSSKRVLFRNFIEVVRVAFFKKELFG